MEEVYDLAGRSALKSGNANKRRYDKTVKCVDITVGDRILLQNVNKTGTGKLSSYWSLCVYVVFTIREYEGRKTKIIHRNLLTLRSSLVLTIDLKPNNDKV